MPSDCRPGLRLTRAHTRWIKHPVLEKGKFIQMRENDLMTHVLIVEDQQENQNLLKLLLEVNGYRVTAAGNGLEALAAARHDPPDAVVSDVLMPKMDGYALCRAWRQDTALSPIPFIFYSATAVQAEDQQFALVLGAERYLMKPIAAEVFLRELRLVLQKSTGRAVNPAPATLDETKFHALHKSALARTIEGKIAQLEAANRKLQESEARFRSLTEMSSDFYWESDAEHRLVARDSANKKLSTVSAFQRGAQIGERRWEIPYVSPDAAGWAAHRALLDAHQPFRNFELSRLGADGTERIISISGDPVFDASGAFAGYRGVGTDITERRKTEVGLKLFRHLIDQSTDGIEVVDPGTFRFLDVNQKACRDVGYSCEEMLSKTVFDIDPRFDRSRAVELIQDLRQAGSVVIESRHRRKDGSEFPVEVSLAYVQLDRDYVLAIVRDISERIRATQQLVEAEAKFRGMVEQSISGICIIQDARFAYVNPRFAEICGYASAGEVIGLDANSLVAAKDRAMVAEQSRRLLAGETRSMSLSYSALRKDGSSVEVGAHGARAIHEGRPAIIGLMQDISEKRRAEEEIKRHVEQLEIAFMSTVEVATTLGEMRDPYTAGHQRRVAEIAVAIGIELGFDERRQEGLRVAGYLHDLGKITVPAEILSKPTRLTPVELTLIQGHAQAGFEVLKNVTFPWPVAEVARQHHERIDGSGYPQGLKGEAILLEARIMAVADVVEAMSSHRPYRPGLGIDRALAEIERGRGTAYDPAVADACLRLFRENRYQLPA